ncbi:ubiquitin carboxyl-terminal hydrolase 21-like isoform X1 [Olea europaea var. sylvestris]|uniref:ubiquitin carboxyl-terminal hydrolase 21-like isoform X1 n=1 Tax=Olea europaea var. sylvestris TaxID=158386 RepID=UPI000C1D2C61|nr:ubiquitin carboxyl-terminal hydrolase 21-like isoform X1 [Olea europaea var. sylvestris]
MENNSAEIALPNSFDPAKTLDGQTLDQHTGSYSKLENPSIVENLSTVGSEELQEDSDLLDAFLYMDEENEEKESEIGEDEHSNWSPTTDFSAGPCSKNYDLNGESLALNIKPSASDWGKWPSPKRPAEIEFNTPVLSLLLEDAKPVIVGAGFANLGNTCFLNAVLQCFIHTVPLLQGLFYSSHLTPCHFYSDGFCVLCDLRELVELSLISAGRTVTPGKLVNSLSYFSSSFRRFQQEDAHEFLQCFLDRLESSENSKLKEAVSSRNDNFVKQVFGGRLVSKLKCCNCGHSSDTYEPSIDLSLEIEDADTLLIALQSFTKVEKIEDQETRFTCEECKEQVSVEKQLVLDHAPAIAAFHLKRFKSDGCYVEKIDKHVAFPLELDLLPFTGGDKTNDAELKYELYAVVVHVGFTSTSGHYYCFIRVSPDTWCKFDDSKVFRVHEQFVLSQEAYILFYAKQGTTWFSNFIESQKLGIHSTVLNNSPKSVLDNPDIYASPLVQNYHGSDVNGRDDTADESLPEDYSEPKLTGVENIENKDNRSSAIGDLPKESTSLPKVVNNPSNVTSHVAHKVISSSSLKKINIDMEVGAVGNKPNITLTPQRSSSPEMYREDEPDAGLSIPHDHLRLVDSISCKRKLEKDLDDQETKQAFSFIKKSIPGSRGQQLMAALMGPRSEGAVNKKRSKRMSSSPNRVKSTSTTRDRSSIGTKARPLVAGGFR